MLWHFWAHTDSYQPKALEVPALGSQLLMGKLEAHKCPLTCVLVNHPMNGMGACVPGAKPILAIFSLPALRGCRGEYPLTHGTEGLLLSVARGESSKKD